MQPTTLLSTLLLALSTTHAMKTGLSSRQAHSLGSIDRWNEHACAGNGCHVREQGDVYAGVCSQTTDIDGFGGCRGSASVSGLDPGCSITLYATPDCTGDNKIVATGFGQCLEFPGQDILAFTGSCP